MSQNNEVTLHEMRIECVSYWYALIWVKRVHAVCPSVGAVAKSGEAVAVISSRCTDGEWIKFLEELVKY